MKLTKEDIKNFATDKEKKRLLEIEVSVPKSLVNDLINFLLDSEVSDQRDDLLTQLNDVLGSESDLFMGDIEPEGMGIRRLERK